ncbi:MAG: hypothetical protein ABSD10_03780 [Candidatus Saccharimonadales bacterium]|jgi:hypothetical protein
MRKPLTIKLALSVILALIIIGSLGSYLYVHNRNTSSYSHPYTYHKLINTSLTGNGASNGFVFDRPAEFTAIAPEGKPNIANFAQDISSKGISNTLGGEAAFTAVAPADYSSIIDKDFSLQTTSSDYRSAITPVHNFLMSEIPYIFFFDDKNAKLDLSLAKPYQIYTNNLNRDAWIFNFMATNTNLKNSKQKVSIIQGKLALVVGKTDYYYLLLGTTSSNWNVNSSTWESILLSLKIDQ